MKQTTISDDVLDVLRRSTLDSAGLKLPEQLDRALYTKVAKVLEANGAKWNRSAKRHTFTSAEALSKISAAVEGGKYVDEKKAYDFFQTPDYIAADMALMLDPVFRVVQADCPIVLEPSAGHGRLARAIWGRCARARVTAMELNPTCIAELMKIKAALAPYYGMNVEEVDFMQVKPTPHYHAVIMNPPFSNGLDVEHVLHAMNFLLRGGRLVAIVSPGYTFREGKKWEAFRTLLKKQKVICEKDLPAGTFKAEGTNVSTRLICVEKS